MEKVTKESADYMRRTLENIRYLKREYKRNVNDAKMYQEMLDKECDVKSVPYDRIPGCTRLKNITYVNELAIKQATFEKKAKDAFAKRELLDNDNLISERLKQIPKKQRDLIVCVYFEDIPAGQLLEKYKINHKRFNSRLNYAIQLLTKAEV